MKTGEVISIKQIRDEYLSAISNELEGLNNPQLAQQLVQILNHFCIVIENSNVLLLKVIDVEEQTQSQNMDDDISQPPTQYVENRGRPRKYAEEENVEEKPKEFIKNDVGMNPTELKLKEEYERKIKELNEQIKISDDAVKEKQYDDIKEPPMPETKKTNFLDKLKPSK